MKVLFLSLSSAVSTKKCCFEGHQKPTFCDLDFFVKIVKQWLLSLGNSMLRFHVLSWSKKFRKRSVRKFILESNARFGNVACFSTKISKNRRRLWKNWDISCQRLFLQGMSICDAQRLVFFPWHNSHKNTSKWFRPIFYRPWHPTALHLFKFSFLGTYWLCLSNFLSKQYDGFMI